MKERSISRSCGSSSGNGSLQSGDIGKQSQGQILFDDKKRPKTARARDGELGANRLNRAPVEAGGPEVRMIHNLRALAAKLRGLFGDRRADQDLDGEIETHLRLLAERYVRQGMTETEALLAARRQFGNVTLLKEANREIRGIRFIETLFQDLRFGVRMLLKNKSFTALAVLSLALGIGANTALFQLLDAVRLRTLPVKDPQELAEVRLADMKGARGGFGRSPSVTNWIWERIRERQQAFSNIFAWGTDNNVNIAPSGEVRRARMLYVSGD